jgi:hypothetical protein
MSAPDPVPSERLAELLVSAAAQLSSPSARVALAPAGVPIRRGRLHLGRLRSLLDGAESVVVTVGFASAVWLGRVGSAAPDLGRLAYRSDTRVDSRGRVVLDARVRSWLAVGDPMAFDVVIVPAAEGGLLVVPVDDFARRWEVISR